MRLTLTKNEMSKVKVLFIMDFENHPFIRGLSQYQIDVYRKAHQCDEVIQVPVSQPLKNVEYPRFEVRQFDVKEASFIDVYKQQIADTESRVKDLDMEVNFLKLESANKVDKKYKLMFYTILVLFLFMSMMLYFKL